MGYPEAVNFNSVKRKSAASDTAANLAATAAQWAPFSAMGPLQVTRVKFVVTTQVTAGLVAPQVRVQRRPTPGSASNAVTLVTMTIPSGALVGQVYYRDVVYGAGTANKYINAGEDISLDVSVQATDAGTAAGAGFIEIEYDMATDASPNQPNMIQVVLP